jgi:hypothetical protein
VFVYWKNIGSRRFAQSKLRLGRDWVSRERGVAKVRTSNF